jgi:hypothetical protein
VASSSEAILFYLKMDLPEIYHSKINELLTTIDLVEETVAQIQKDFALFGITIHFSGNIQTAYNEMLEQLSGQIMELIVNDYSRLLSVLYQIDLNDRDIQKAHIELPEYSIPEITAHQIIVRELKKVLTRRYFKSHP